MSTYTVVAGDSFYAIADRLGVDRGAFAAANPQVADINRIVPGQVLNVPGGAPPGGTALAASGMNPYVVAGGVGLAVGLLWLLLKPRANPAPRKRKKLRKMTPAQYAKLARTGLTVGTSIARQYR